MSRAARSVYLFGIYLIATGGVLFGAPNALLAVLGQPSTTEPWIHILGVPVMSIGMLFVGGARAEQRAFIQVTVWVRSFATIALVTLVVMHIAPPIIIAFAVVDAVGALWTRVALREVRILAEPAP